MAKQLIVAIGETAFARNPHNEYFNVTASFVAGDVIQSW
jgi:hypothetical protein